METHVHACLWESTLLQFLTTRALGVGGDEKEVDLFLRLQGLTAVPSLSQKECRQWCCSFWCFVCEGLWQALQPGKSHKTRTGGPAITSDDFSMSPGVGGREGKGEGGTVIWKQDHQRALLAPARGLWRGIKSPTVGLRHKDSNRFEKREERMEG